LHHILDGIGLEKVFIVQVIEQVIQSPLGIIDLCLERRWSSSLDALHVFGQNLEDRQGIGGDMGAVTGG
jgi:hypothetical protein